MNLIASTSTFSFFTLISRALGYVRDILIAIFLGTSLFADAFFVAFRLPNTFRRLFAEGAFNAAFIPSYAGELAQDKKQADHFARNIFNLLFIILLFFVLITAGTLLLINFKSYDDEIERYKKIPMPISFIIGGILGFISGSAGIGGGIFLSPILFLLRVASPKHIVTAASLFILINSISGIIGQLTKNTVLLEIQNYWYLLIVVLIGGQVGNFLNLKIFPVRVLALITASLVIFVAIRIGFNFF